MADKKSLIETEPVSLTAALTAAVNSTLGLLAVAFEWKPEVSGGLLAASGAWIVVFMLIFARSQVTPNVNVALTTDEEALIKVGQAEARAEAATSTVAPHTHAEAPAQGTAPGDYPGRRGGN